MNYKFIGTKLFYFSWILKTFRVYFPGIASVALIYFVMIRLTQGQDVMMQIAELPGPLGWTLCNIVLWSIFMWYSSRLVGYVKSVQPDNIIPEHFHQHVPRLLAFNAIVSIQAAILALPTIGNLSEWMLWGFIIFQNILYFIWDNLFTTPRPRARYRVLTGLVIAFYLGWMIYLLMRKPLVTHQQFLPMISIFLFACELLLVFFFIRRRTTMPAGADVGEPGHLQVLDRTALKIMGRKIVEIPSKFAVREQPYFVKFNIVALLGMVLYAGSFFFIALADKMGPLAVTVLALGILVGFANILTVISINTKTNIFFYLFVVALVVGRIYDPYNVRLKETMHPGFYAQRPTVQKYFQNWVNLRRDKIEASKEFPVYLVIADGGASRSGYWVASVLSALQDESIKHDTSDLFSDHLLCLAGASGGSVGNATFYALLENQPEGDTTFLDKSREFLGQDFLAPVITHWLGSDLIQHIVPLTADDRAAVLERTLERFSKITLRDSFAKDVSAVLDTTGELPMLFINVTHVQEGAPAVISTVRLDSFTKRLDVLDSVSTALPDNQGDIRFSTAVVLGARFPYVSPGGNIGDQNYADGGYFDNTGAGVVHEMMQKLTWAPDSTASDPVLSKLRFRLLYLSNASEALTGNKKLHPLLNDALTPVFTVLGTYASQTEVNNQRLISFMKNLSPAGGYTKVNLYTEKDSIDYPMNWVISNYNLERMNERLEQVKKTNAFANLLEF